MLGELPFYNELNIIRQLKAFREYAEIHSVEITDSRDRSIQFTAIKSGIKDLLEDLLIK